MKKIWILCFLITSMSVLYADEKADLNSIVKYINDFNIECSCYSLRPTSKDQLLFPVNYYIIDGLFKKVLKGENRDEYIQKFGNKRKWLVSKNQGVGEFLYLFHAIQEVDDSWQYSPKHKVQNMQDTHNFAFKNYCEVEGKIQNEFARIKKLKITFFESQYQVINSGMNYHVYDEFRKTKSFEVSFPNQAEIVYPMPAYKPVGSTENVPGTIIVLQLNVLEVYPGEEGKPLCAEDFYLGYKARGEYTEVLKQIDKI
ncbi:hypothetical protein EHQ96_10320 [Leptospira levettii]|uniref:hypothetical protein n=1 Tax=Leptospira levettii TaxID=2023178 RepID=UPI0010838AFF|nr:hypothetical protein [Leptospira levettii]TGM36091.1 hypothetical protein EHQ75_13025 [Leptospira levettii]TGM69883.1 hypothetical protein EHQ96_10320 [Leptospira levettii]TGM76723.1 hypothetical protein EHR04_14585 [Leptospira levettii]